MNLYQVTKFSPYFSLTLYCFYAKISSFMPVLTIGIVLDSFYLLVSYSEKFSAWVWSLPFAVNVNLKPHGKNKIPHARQNQKPHGKTKDLTAKSNTTKQKPNSSWQKQIPTAKPKLFCFCCEVFGFAGRFLVLPWGFRFCRDTFGPP